MKWRGSYSFILEESFFCPLWDILSITSERLYYVRVIGKIVSHESFSHEAQKLAPQDFGV